MATIQINDDLSIPESEIELVAIRSQGPGGQHVNKVSTAIQLRFDISVSAALPDEVKARLLALRDRRISRDGIINIKAQRSRSQDKNRADALRRFTDLIQKAAIKKPPRKKTRPTKKSREKRLSDKAHRARVKRSRSSLEE